jgi:hypothetical protein
MSESVKKNIENLLRCVIHLRTCFLIVYLEGGALFKPFAIGAIVVSLLNVQDTLRRNKVSQNAQDAQDGEKSIMETIVQRYGTYVVFILFIVSYMFDPTYRTVEVARLNSFMYLLSHDTTHLVDSGGKVILQVFSDFYKFGTDKAEKIGQEMKDVLTKHKK